MGMHKEIDILESNLPSGVREYNQEARDNMAALRDAEEQAESYYIQMPSGRLESVHEWEQVGGLPTCRHCGEVDARALALWQLPSVDASLDDHIARQVEWASKAIW